MLTWKIYSPLLPLKKSNSYFLWCVDLESKTSPSPLLCLMAEHIFPSHPHLSFSPWFLYHWIISRLYLNVFWMIFWWFLARIILVAEHIFPSHPHLSFWPWYLYHWIISGFVSKAKIPIAYIFRLCENEKLSEPFIKKALQPPSKRIQLEIELWNIRHFERPWILHWHFFHTDFHINW